MLIDITLKITEKMLADARNNTNPALAGHLGTHFDVMNKVFPLEYIEREGVVFDVRGVAERDIELSDIDISKVKEGAVVAFYTAFIEREEYGTAAYFKSHPQLSAELIDALLEKKVSIIGLDFAGVRRGGEHIPTDQRCADRGVFIIENLCNLNEVLAAGGSFTACTYPINCDALTGLPCRVIAKI